MAKAKRILFIAMSDSIHTARWLEQLQNQGWDIHLFPSVFAVATHPRISQVTIHTSRLEKWILFNQNLSLQNPFLKFCQRLIRAILRRVVHYLIPSLQPKKLAKLITQLQPDIIHSLEIQHAGYLTLAAKKHVNAKFPPWIVTNWGSDIFLFGQYPEHQSKIREVLANCDYYSCECERDVQLAKQFGFDKTILPVFPNTGGFDLKQLETIRNQQRTSQRKLIMLKGYQHFAGRALIGLQALRECADVLTDYTVAIYSAAPVVVKKAKEFAETTGIAVKIIPGESAHEDILAHHAQARISIGLSISDAISTSLLETMVMGSFPIQSCTACADEWIEHGISGAIVPPEEPEIIAMHIRKALSDDALVNQAADINWQTALARLDNESLKQKAIALYNSVEKQ